MLRSKFARMAVCVVVAVWVATAVLATGASHGDATKAKASASAGKEADAARDLKKFLKRPTKLPDWPAITGTVPRNQTVYFMSGGDPTSDIISQGLKSATNTLGWELRTLVYQPADPSSLNSGILSAIDGGANAVVFTTAPEAALTEAIAAANARNVFLVQIGGDTRPDQSAFLHVDNVHSTASRWAQMLAAATVADAKKKGETANVAVFQTSVLPSLGIINEQYQGELKRYCSKCTSDVIDANVGNVFTGQTSKDAVSALQRDQNLNYLEFTLGFISVGVRPGVNSAGFTDARIVGMLPTPAQLEELKNGGSSAWVVVPNRLDGWMAIDAVARGLTGGDPKIHNNEVEPAWVLQRNSKFVPSTLPELPIRYSKVFKNLWNVD